MDKGKTDLDQFLNLYNRLGVYIRVRNIKGHNNDDYHDEPSGCSIVICIKNSHRCSHNNKICGNTGHYTSLYFNFDGKFIEQGIFRE